MKRALAILLLLVTLMGWLRAAYGEEDKGCCCGAECACQTADSAKSDCPCNCGKEKKHLEEMPLTLAEWPEAVLAPEVRTPIPPVAYRELSFTEAAALSHSPWHGAPPGNTPSDALLSEPTPYIGFLMPLRA